MNKKQYLVILLVLTVLLCGCKKETAEETQTTGTPVETSAVEMAEETRAVVSEAPTVVPQVLPDMELEDIPENTGSPGTAQKPVETIPKETEAVPTAPAKEEPASPRQNGSNDTWDNEL